MNGIDNTIRVITNSLKSLNEEDFSRLVDESVNTIKNGKKIVVTGLGKNVSICEKFVGTLLSLSIPSFFLHTNSAIHGDIGAIAPGDLVIILSKSGETSESIELYSHLENLDVCNWLITFKRESTLCRSIPNKLVLNLEHEGDPWNILPNNSTIVNLIILEELAMQLVKILDIKLEIFKANHPGGAIGNLLRGVKYD